MRLVPKDPPAPGVLSVVDAREDILRRVTSSLPAMLADLEALITTESPSADLDAVARSADVIARVGAARLGVEPERLIIDGCTHLRWRLGNGPARVLVLCHHDTVWPLGSLASHPFTIEDGILRGPGCFDMKAGLVMALHAVAIAVGIAAADGAGVAVTLLVTGDEEVGSPSSRSLIEAEAAGCAAAFVLEASADGGALKLERKGVSRYEVQVTGRAAHAGTEPERGINATIEAAHQVLAVSGLADPLRATTVTPTALVSGTTSNTVPATASFAVDVRVRDAAEQQRVDEAIRALRPVLDGARLHVSGGPNRPPMERGASRGLYERACALATDLGLAPLTWAAVGGASDGNFTAGIGTPTVDGLGAVGGGAHAEDEHLLVGELPGRTALLAALITDVGSTPPS